MRTKLTLRMDDRLISEAKRIAKIRGKTLSLLVADYFGLLKRESESMRDLPEEQATPWTQSLIGIAKPINGQSVGTEQLRLEHLAENYQLELDSSNEDTL